MCSIYIVVVILSAQTAVITQVQGRLGRDPCQDFQCQNGGECTAPYDDPYCICPSQYTGTFCDEILVCQNYTCENGGRCTSSNDYPVCQCLFGFDGEHCEIQVKPGLCPPVNDSSEMGSCGIACSNDYDCQGTEKCCRTPCGGWLCIPVNPCDGYCLNGGVCSHTDGVPECKCLDGFSGNKCDTTPSIHPGLCPIVESHDMGVCGGVLCTTDDNCTIDQKCCNSSCGNNLCTIAISIWDPCQNVDCQNGGYCTAPADAPYCLCQPEYTGELCENRIISRNPCLNYICKNGGRCTSPLDYPVCQCLSGFGGVHCEVKVKPGLCPSRDPGAIGICGGDICSTDDNCTDDKKCCPSACGGNLCTTPNQNPCDGLCLNGGFCSQMSGAPECECLDGFSGDRCEISVHPGTCPIVEPGAIGICGGDICSTDDNCTDDKKCCPSACGGNLCTTPNLSRNPCLNYICENGGRCTSPLDYPVCQCQSGFGGVHCEVKVKPGLCPSRDPGAIGICGGDICSTDDNCTDDKKCCPSACGGNLCTTPNQNPCDGLCLNGGFCSQMSGAPECECLDGFSGDRCEISVHPGTCPIVEPGAIGICGGDICSTDDNCTADKKCCPSACGGNLCTTPNQNPCDGLCLNGGFCSQLSGAPECKCLDGFSGDRCEISVHPGTCPIVEPGAIGLCGGDICSTDDNCTADKKCCPSACGGNLCTTPNLPALTCASILCPFEKFCHSVASSTKYQLTVACVPKEVVEKDIDKKCQRHNYSQVVLVEDPNNSSSYISLACNVSLDEETCPLGSICLEDETKTGSCCTGKIDPPPPAEKPGFCPQGDSYMCGGTFCTNDTDCPGAQKCCPGCGKMCTEPVGEECGNRVCKSDEICLQKLRPCEPGRMCIAALEPTCVPVECPKCEYNQRCNKRPNGYECVPIDYLDMCGGCQNDTVCIDTGLRCFTTPCATYQCVENNECGGCPNNQVCIDTKIRCIKAPCPTYQCVEDNECGGCSNGKVCIDTKIRCIKAPCPTYQCVEDNECGGCSNGKVCIDTKIRCIKEPCPTYQCVEDNECGGCPNGKVCINTGIICKKEPCPTFQCVPDNECGGCPDGQVCKGLGINCNSSSCQSFQCVPIDECGGCPKGQVCKDTGTRCITADCPSFKCTSENEPICPLRCPKNYECKLYKNKCLKTSRDSCYISLSPKCVRIKHELGKCPRVTKILSRFSLLCLFEKHFFKCQNDNDCKKANERCCSSACRNKLCTAVNKRIGYLD